MAQSCLRVAQNSGSLCCLDSQDSARRGLTAGEGGPSALSYSCPPGQQCPLADLPQRLLPGPERCRAAAVDRLSCRGAQGAYLDCL
eukprot:1158010-Pelagomonas_calceolata.AAC.12